MYILFKECTLRFSSIHLPSHDQWHHLRVWHFAKELVAASEGYGITVTESDIEDLMIAVFFHDQGMSETASKEHGAISRSMCSDFFASGELSYTPSGILLNAIESHDRKNYADTSAIKAFDMHNFLSIADDLDAFGITGAYRYLEIYLVREVNMLLLPYMILENLESRYRHFHQTFMPFKSLINIQQLRYEKTVSFFNDLQAQLSQKGYDENETQGTVGVLNIIRQEIIGAGKRHDEVGGSINEKQMPYSFRFFKELNSECSTFLKFS